MMACAMYVFKSLRAQLQASIREGSVIPGVHILSYIASTISAPRSFPPIFPPSFFWSSCHLSLWPIIPRHLMPRSLGPQPQPKCCSLVHALIEALPKCLSCLNVSYNQCMAVNCNCERVWWELLGVAFMPLPAGVHFYVWFLRVL